MTLIKRLMAATALIGAMTTAATGAATAETCAVDPEMVGATYRISFVREGSALKTKNNAMFSLWRRPNQVAHEHYNKSVTEVWSRSLDGRMKIERYFDAHERAIEYYPSDLPNNGETIQWEKKSQLISNGRLAAMTLVETTGEGCEKTQRYTETVDGMEIILDWMPELKIIAGQTINKSGGVEQWDLLNWTADPADIDAEFDDRVLYQATDFADIGDNESDPFLLNMINLGFIEHGASGFYTSDGQLMVGNHFGHRH